MSSIGFKFKNWHQLFGNFFVRGGGALLEILFVIMVADKLGLSQSASFFVAYSIAVVLATFARGGEDIRIVRDIPKYTQNGNFLAVQNAIFNAFIRVAVLSIVITFVVFFLSRSGAFVFLVGEDASYILSILIWSIMPLAFIFLCAEVLRGYQIIVLSQLIYGWSALLPTFLFLFFSNDMNAISVANIFVKSSSIVAASLLLLILWKNNFFWQNKSYQNKSGKKIDSFFFIKVVVLTSAWLPVWLINFFQSGEVAGLFIIANRFAMGITLALIAVEASAGPRFSALSEAGDKVFLEKYLVKTQKTSLMVSLLIGLIALLMSPFIADYLNLESREIFFYLIAILIFGYTINAYFAPIGTFFTMTNKEKTVLKIYLVGILLTAPIMILLLNGLGVIGLALGCVIAYLIRAYFLTMYYKNFRV
jgi:O-antigen/teichoic acid export membrane protein